MRAAINHVCADAAVSVLVIVGLLPARTFGRPTFIGSGAGFVIVALLVLILGPVFARAPLQTLPLDFGFLLLLYGL